MAKLLRALILTSTTKKDEGLALETPGQNASLRISLRWSIHIINSVDKTKLSTKKDFCCESF